jgi:hypothetical protein
MPRICFAKSIERWLAVHKEWRSTEISINVEQAIFEDTSDDFHVRVAGTP